MTRYSYLPITAAEVPVAKVLTVGGQKYVWGFSWNELHDFYTLTIKDQEGLVIYIEKLVLGGNLLATAVSQDLGITGTLVPRDFTGSGAEQVLAANLGDPVKVYNI